MRLHTRVSTTLTALLFMLSFYSVSSRAQSVDLNDAFYYAIGGSSASLDAGGYRQFTLIDASAELRLSLSCGAFDLEENLKQLFDDFNNLGDKLVNAAVLYANSVINNLPLLILREAWPNLAKMYENALARYEELIRIAVRDCQETERMILDGENPFRDWIKVSRASKWERGYENGDTATETEEEVAVGSPEPIVWIGGQPAGTASDLLIVRDLVRYGYSELTSGGVGRVGVVWPSDTQAIDFAQRVIGEIEINLEGVPASSPGEGVLPSMEEQREELVIALTDAVQRGNAPFDDLTAMSSPTVRVTPTILQRLRSHRQGARVFLISRLAGEIATANAAEKIMLLRRIFLTAMREPHVMATPARDLIKTQILPELDAEYQYLTDVAQMSQVFVSQTSRILMGEYDGRLSKAPTFIGAPDDVKTTEGVLSR